MKTGFGKMLKNVPLGLRLRKKGRVPLKTNSIKNIKELSGIIRRVQEKQFQTKHLQFS